MTNGPVCPPECKAELKHLWKKIDSLRERRKDCEAKVSAEQAKQWEIIDQNYKHWEAEMAQMVRTQTLIGVVGVVVTVLMVLLGLIFSSLNGAMEKQLGSQNALHRDVTTIQRSVDRLEMQVDAIEKRDDE